MFDAFVKWMYAPGAWNDGIVYLVIVLVFLVSYLVFAKD